MMLKFNIHIVLKAYFIMSQHSKIIVGMRTISDETNTRILWSLLQFQTYSVLSTVLILYIQIKTGADKEELHEQYYFC